MTVVSIGTGQIGTKLATGADTKITGLTMTQPTASADLSTPLTLVDAAAAPTSTSAFPRQLFNALFSALTFVFGVKPTAPSMAPGLTAPTWPQGLVTGNIPFSSGVFVASCPAGATFSLTTAP